MIENWANGCAQANVSPIDIENLIIVKPSDNLLDDFEKLLKPVASKQIANCKNVNYLTHLRDSLLPMLMNGQVTVE